MRCSRTVRSAVVGVLLGAGLLVPAAPAGAAAESAAGSPAACAQTIFYGVRGTGESQTEELGLGSTLYTVYRDLTALVGSVQGIGSVYPARFLNYDGSVQKGVTATVTDLTELATNCPQGTTFVIAGYSQGADVVRRALAELDESVLPHATVLLFGDPNFSADEQFVSATSRIELTGDFAVDARRAAGGVDAAPPFDTSRWSLYSYCHGRDAVCAHTGGVIEHLTYISIDAAGAAARAAEAYYGTQRPTRLPAPLAQLNGGSCSVDEQGAAMHAVSIGLSTQWSPATRGVTYRFYRGKELTFIGALPVLGGFVNPAYQLPTIAGQQLITVTAQASAPGVDAAPLQIAQRYLNVPTC